ncbi:MAG: sugar nucleotide-binding protein [Marinagarivorans sp.]|nr:sugar nucleotide-binding protein [Marinagarivorans sp.]
MGFRVIVFTDSDNFYSAFERAFELLSFSLVRAPVALLQDALNLQDSTALQAYLLEQRACTVVNAMCVNRLPTNMLAAACTLIQTPLLHLSSYRVFGAHQKMLDEDVMPSPDDDEGRWLLSLEQSVLTAPQAIVLRLPWLLVGASESLLVRVCESLLSSQPTLVSEECSGYVVVQDDVARFVVAMIQQIIVGAENWGVFHLRSSDTCSEAEFTDAIARLLKAEGWQDVAFSTYKGTSDVMPKSGMLQGRRCTDAFGIQFRSFRLGLKVSLQNYLAQR